MFNKEDAQKLLKAALEPVQSLLTNKAIKASVIIWALAFKDLSQFFHNRLHFSSHEKECSTTQRLGITLKIFNSDRLAISTEQPRISFAELANFSPVYPESAIMLRASERWDACDLKIASAPFRSVTLAVVTPRACGKPLVSTAIWRLMPDTFLPAS